MDWKRYEIPALFTVGAFVLAWIFAAAGTWWAARSDDRKESFRRQKVVNTLAVVLFAAITVLTWARFLQHTSTFLGLIGAGLAVALREPLLSIAGRIAIFTSHMYGVGDRIQIDEMSGDVIDVGTFYTRMMEIGNWVGGDQPSGRIVQFSNSIIFGKPVYNYTQNFSYIWDEIKLPITYSSNVEAVRAVMLDAATLYTREFLHEAEADMLRMRKFFLVPDLELKPAVFMKVTDNWIELTLRYIVDPKMRRIASTFLYAAVFERIENRNDIKIASSTMEITVHQEERKDAA